MLHFYCTTNYNNLAGLLSLIFLTFAPWLMSYFAKKLIERAAKMMFSWLKRRQIISMTILNWKQHSLVVQVETDRHYVTRTHAHSFTQTHTRTVRQRLPSLKAIRKEMVFRIASVTFISTPLQVECVNFRSVFTTTTTEQRFNPNRAKRKTYSYSFVALMLRKYLKPPDLWLLL